VDIRHKNNIKKTDKQFSNLKININKTIRRGALLQDFESIYDVIMTALKIKKSSNLNLNSNSNTNSNLPGQQQSQIQIQPLSLLQSQSQNINYKDLFSPKIYNTISIDSPHYELLNYRQINIFNDPVHEEMLKHDSSLPLNLIKIDFGNMFIDHKEIDYLGKIINNDNNKKINEGILYFKLDLIKFINFYFLY
jgi:hypothetical protein